MSAVTAVPKEVKASPQATAPATIDKSNWEYVTIPEVDAVFDHTYPTIRLNWDAYEPGQKYFVSPDVAFELKRIIRTFDASQLRILQPKKDISALRNLALTRGHSGQEVKD